MLDRPAPAFNTILLDHPCAIWHWSPHRDELLLVTHWCSPARGRRRVALHAPHPPVKKSIEPQGEARFIPKCGPQSVRLPGSCPWLYAVLPIQCVPNPWAFFLAFVVLLNQGRFSVRRNLLALQPGGDLQAAGRCKRNDCNCNGQGRRPGCVRFSPRLEHSVQSNLSSRTGPS